MNIIIEKIRTWVNQRKKALHSTLFNDEYNDFLRFLSNIEKECEEKPTNIDFEQELYKHFGQVKDFTLGMQIGKYFYELGREHQRTVDADLGSPKYERGFEDGREYERKSKEQPVCEGFNEEFHRWLKGEIKEHFGFPSYGEYGLLCIARHFAQWQKEQMVKEAVEGDVVKDINNKLAVTAKNVNLDKFKFGDKVRVIVLKKED